MKIFQVILASIFFLIPLSAGNITKEQLVVSYVYKLSKNIRFNNSKNSFSIHLVSSDTKLNNEFKQLARNLKMDNKKILITTSKNEHIARGVDVVYVSSEKSSYYKKIFTRTKNHPILLISNDYDDKKLVMINLLNDDKRVNFEINRANILSKGLGIKPDIILLGGTELDVAHLYRDARDNLSSKELELQKSHAELSQSKSELSKSKSELQKQKKKLHLMKKELVTFKKKNNLLKQKIKTKEKVLIKTKKEIRKYSKDVSALKTTIDDKNNKISNQENKLNTLSVEFDKTKKDLKKIETSLDEQKKELNKKQKLLKKQELKVAKKEKYLQELEIKIVDKTEEFKSLKLKLLEQNKLVQTHEQTIGIQQDFIWLSLSVLLVFLLVVILVTYLLKKQKSTNILLETTQEELRIAIDKADKASLNKSKFLASMSHELRTPLNAVLGYSQLLQRDKTFSDKHQKTFATIRNSGEHLLGLINDILLISKMEAGHIEIEKQSTNIYELMDSMYAMFLLKTDKKAISLEVVMSDNLPKYLMTDVDKLRQIIINLLNNAVKFTHKGGIKIAVDYVDGNLFVSVEDSGVGVADDEIDKLFKQYEQTSSGVKDGTGTGLGLALVKEFMHLFDGEVSVSSVLGSGSVFKIRIPCLVSKETTDSIKLKNIIKIAPNQKEFNILVVDDIETNRDLLVELLTLIGYKTVELVNGLEAVEYVAKNTPDLILMDLRMPVMNGRDATQKILEIDKNIPVIAITASILEMKELIQNPAPFVAAIPKPFDETFLLNLMAKYIDVSYEYEDDEPVLSETSEVSLSSLPAEEKEKLYKAVKSMKLTAVNRILDEFESGYEKEVKYMQGLVLDFNFEKLRDMLTS